ncbi:hypothetical protein Nepgr_002965 [Nepenthes gracilis]|uniref:Uncharacterized protein n=1 Tax=Nepenthes gracilis TaxID=150966 RepID=A0AAD3XD37_NEPGR|nr:hypothetical protein Nepgr_002965 [Nepenthes gracilis]
MHGQPDKLQKLDHDASFSLILHRWINCLSSTKLPSSYTPMIIKSQISIMINGALIGKLQLHVREPSDPTSCHGRPWDRVKAFQAMQSFHFCEFT